MVFPLYCYLVCGWLDVDWSLLLDVDWLLLLNVNRRLLLDVGYGRMRMMMMTWWWVLHINSCVVRLLGLGVVHIRRVTRSSVWIIWITHPFKKK